MSDIEFFLRENKKVKKYSDFPTSPVDILWANEDTKQLLERILPLNNPSKTAMYECVQGTKGVLIQALFCDIGGDRMVRGYQDKVSLQSQDKDLTRFKLKGTISTNGLVLNLLAYDTTQTKKTAATLTDEDYANINWKRGAPSCLKTLSSHSTNQGDAHPQTPQLSSDVILVIVNALTFSSLDPHNPNLRQTVKNKRKREKAMIEVESAIPNRQESTNLDVLQEFYESRWHLKKKWDLRKGSTSYVRLRGTASVEDALGIKECLSSALGSFESSKGVPSKHTAITRHLVTQVKARGHFTVGAARILHQRPLSRPSVIAFLETVYPRSKYCRALGVENIARIGLAQIERQERPAKYKPTEESPAPAAKRARR
ncbi:hypothetical protein BCR41DRAFT_357186 [Lobosporangium transversale]|uniref:Uncharacterized protein n=1 Tax=Lobosporangium transversale TaxID=64571 RepID=A0A1Y2GH81_9FUNG|nr:hypothetical protein BCR41DRAFT_357186 [Lobosporangium transversale]ORZ10908.1 hypothetical protein BCR41DRAFT_357186 [Lobosporangium transversale]|eukprot:XP_021879425.1 hypothetical protein BCR41DRAFT_357186 [Lobosporangium transversale]